MLDLTAEEKKLTARFSFPPEFIGFQGHFPGKKILPGVCQIQGVLATLEKGKGTAVVLQEVVLAKYTSPLFPGDEVTCVVSDFDDPGDSPTVKAVLTKATTKIAELKLRVCYDGVNGKG
jgi:3-hydroxymyristoyl/3-hydroxydecanoyl-(acyl carrier protein) dehydratase